MKALIVAIYLAVFFRGVYLEDDLLEEIQREEERLPYYLKDDGIKRVVNLNKEHFNKTLKASRMLVVLFYLSTKDNPQAEIAWKTDEKMLEVSFQISLAQADRNGKKKARITQLEISKRPTADRTDLYAIYLSHVTNLLRSRIMALNLICSSRTSRHEKVGCKMKSVLKFIKGSFVLESAYRQDI